MSMTETCPATPESSQTPALRWGRVFSGFTGFSLGAIINWGGFLSWGGLAAWRLANTVHLTTAGLEYRFLGKTQKVIPWSSFSRAVRTHLHKADCIYLIPASCGEIPEERGAQLRFVKRKLRGVDPLYRCISGVPQNQINKPPAAHISYFHHKNRREGGTNL